MTAPPALLRRRVLFWHTLSSADLKPRLRAAQALEGIPSEFLPYL